MGNHAGPASVISRIGSLCLVLSLWAVSERAFSQGTAGRLPPDYYSKDRGVLEMVVLEGILNKPEWSEEDVAKLSLLVKNSSASRLREIDKGIRGFSERGGHEQEVEMLVAVAEDLRSGREKILSHLLSYFEKGMYETGRIWVLRSVFPDEMEVEPMLELVPGLWARSEGDGEVWADSFTSLAVDRGMFSGEKRSAPYFAPIVSLLSQMAEEKPGETERGCGFTRSRLRSASAKTLLVKIGTDKGRQVLAESIARSTDTRADLTALSDSMPETMSYFVASPASAHIEVIERIGDNIRRIGSAKLSEVFFNNVRILLSSAKRKAEGEFAAALLAYLKAQSGNARHPAWARQAQKAIDRLQHPD